MALKLSLLLQAVDRISAPVRRIRDSVSKMGDGVERAARKVDRAGAPMGRLGAKAQALRNKLLGVLVAANRAGGPNGLDLLGKASDKAGYAVGSLIRKLGGAAVGLAKWGAAAGAGATGFALFDMFKTAGEFEELQLQLENTYGSAQKAKEALAWVQKFSATTPYELGEVSAAFTALADSIDPKNGTLRSLGDAASARRKTLGDAAEMFLDAQTFQFERLMEFGLRANQMGDNVTFSFAKNGKQMTRTVKKDAAEVSRALTEILDLKYGGMMAKKSGGLFGIISNLRDGWSRFLMMVADAGIFEKVKSRLEQILGRVNAMADDGRLQDWAQRVGDKLEQAFDWGWKFVEETDWEGVGTDLARAAEAAGKLASAILTIASAAGQVKRVGANITYGMDWLMLGSREADKNWERMYPDEKRRPSDYEQRRNRRMKPATGNRPGAPSLGAPRPSLPRPKLPNSPRAAADKVQVGGQAKLVIDVRGQGTARLAEFNKKGDVPWSIQIARSNWVPA